ncbi:GAF domain-containing sensor histidine kinase [Nostoc flagelliforme]|nr:GAF domain-containing sensor histidine kinase [Nostoc flagelliforme]
MEFERQVQERIAQLQQALDFEVRLKRITEQIRNSLDENQILQVVVQELTLVLSTISCHTASYNLGSATSTVRYQYTISEHEIIASSLPSVGQVVFMNAFPEVYRQLLQGEHFQFCEIDVSTVCKPLAILACPIIDNQAILGDLWLFKQKTDAFNELEIRLVQQVANQCTFAIRQARFYQASQQRIEELERLNHLKDDFVSTVSHELRTPMTNMRMAIEMLEAILKQSQTLEAKHITATRYLRILRDECQREMSLINDLLDLTRLDIKTEPLVLTTKNLSAWILQILEPFEERFRTQQQQLHIDIPTEIPALTTDFFQLEGILVELFNNAYKYTPANETIAVLLRATPSALRLSVSNSGVEISTDELAHIFDKFYRIPSHNPWKHKGTGLGLALLRKRVEQLQSTIIVSSEQKWITFTLQIPWSIEQDHSLADSIKSGESRGQLSNGA